MSKNPKPLGTEVALYGSKLFRDDAVKLVMERTNVSEQEARNIIRTGMKNIGMEVSPGPEEEVEEEKPEPVVVGECPRCGAKWYANVGFCGGCGRAR